MRYDLTTPCRQCPFRADIRPFIAPLRAREILTSEGTFACHKTLDYSPNEPCETAAAQHCAGFLIIRERDPLGPNQMMRIAGRLGLYDPRRLRMTDEAYPDIKSCLRAHFLAHRK